MAATFNGKVQLGVDASLIDAIDMLTTTSPLIWNPNYVFANGTGANQANQMFTDVRTLTASASEDFDLSGVLVNSLGVTLAFTAIKAFIIQADSTNSNDVVVGGHATAAMASFFSASAHKVKVKPGGMVALIAPDATGYTVTATTADLLTITNVAGSFSATYKIVVIGVV